MGNNLSMTGFGRGEATGEEVAWTVEIRSVNHRYLDVSVKLPRRFMSWDDRIRKEISSCHSRGRVDIFITIGDEAEDSTRLKVDLGLAREYMRCFTELSREFSLQGDPDLAMIASYRDIITPVEDESGPDTLEKYWPGLKKAIGAALEECSQMRQTEGGALQEDLAERVIAFGEKIDVIEKSLPHIIENRENILKERLDNLLAGVDIDPMRLAQEVAVMVDKSDVTEEIVRLRSHMEQFHSLLELDEPVGRRLDFLVQEFLREVNTVASKINHAETAHLVVDLKNDIEKIREQVQNLE